MTGVLIRLYPLTFWIYTGGSKLYNGIGSGGYFGKLDLNISLRLPDYCSVFQAVVMVIYRAAQWAFTDGASFTSVSVFFDSQAAVRSLSEFMIVSGCYRCLGHSDIPGNSRADELARAGALLSELS